MPLPVKVSRLEALAPERAAHEAPAINPEQV
jgi:hypothetical protein